MKKLLTQFGILILKKYTIAVIIMVVWWLSLLLILIVSIDAKRRKVQVAYPVGNDINKFTNSFDSHTDILFLELLLPVNGIYFSSNATNNKLVCFGNRDLAAPTYLDATACLLHFNNMLSIDCVSIWGSRQVEIKTQGSVEFMKVTRVPPESNYGEPIPLNVTRWLELVSSDPKEYLKETKEIAAEPIYLCARSTNWDGSSSPFSVSFQPQYLRSMDRSKCISKIVAHIVLIVMATSIWLLPYIVAAICAVVIYIHGIKIFFVMLAFSSSIICLTPLMLTRNNRQLSRLYISYFFTRKQAQETRIAIRERRPLFQALFFSSVLVCLGSSFSYIIFWYLNIDREFRNMLVKVTLGLASSWFIFFLCRSFERFVRDWIWLIMSVGLAQLLDVHLNPMCRDEIVVTTMLITVITKWLVKRISHTTSVTVFRSNITEKLKKFKTKFD